MSDRCECGGGFVCGYCRRNSTGASLRPGFALGTPNGPAEAELAAARAENERLRAGIEAALVVIDGHDRHQHLFARRIRRALLDLVSS